MIRVKTKGNAVSFYRKKDELEDVDMRIEIHQTDDEEIGEEDSEFGFPSEKKLTSYEVQALHTPHEKKETKLSKQGFKKDAKTKSIAGQESHKKTLGHITKQGGYGDGEQAPHTPITEPYRKGVYEGLAPHAGPLIGDPFAHIVLCSSLDKPIHSFDSKQSERVLNHHLKQCFSGTIQTNFLSTYDILLDKRNRKFMEQVQQSWEKAILSRKEYVIIQAVEPTAYEQEIFSRYFSDEALEDEFYIPLGEYISRGLMPEIEEGTTRDLEFDFINELRSQLKAQTRFLRMKAGCWMLKEFTRIGMKKEPREELYDLFQFQVIHGDFTEKEAWHAAIGQVNSARRLLKNQ